MKNNRIFEGYDDLIDKESRDFFNLYFVTEILFYNSSIVAIFNGPIENELEANVIIDNIRSRLDYQGKNLAHVEEIMTQSFIENYIYDHFKKKLNNLGYLIEYKDTFWK